MTVNGVSSPRYLGNVSEEGKEIYDKGATGECLQSRWLTENMTFP